MVRCLSSWQGEVGLDHGVGHSPLLLCDAKTPNYRRNKASEDSGRHSEWPKVADTVIEAEKCACVSARFGLLTGRSLVSS